MVLKTKSKLLCHRFYLKSRMKTKTNHFFLDFLLAKKYRILRHLSVLLFLFAVIMNSKNSNSTEFTTAYAEDLILCYTFMVIVSMFYLNMYFLVPRTIYKKNYIVYLFGLPAIVFIGVIFIMLFAQLFINFTEVNYIDRIRYFSSIFIDIGLTLLPIIFASSAIKLFQRWVRDSERIRELENQTLRTELKALKNQINPHFLFNMLNNLNVLIKRDPEKASYVTIKLSDFLRHHLYENNAPLVSLESEVKFIEDFLNLEKIRRDDFTFKLSISNRLNTRKTIPSNIFSVFVENAIKHSLDSDKASDIAVKLKMTENNNLLFECINTKPVLNEKEEKKYGGIGLANIKRRLELLYGEEFSLSIIDLESVYRVKLKLPLNASG